MKELSLNILDVANNSLTAGATVLSIDVKVKSDIDSLSITIADNGCGMSKQLTQQVVDPFTTTRDTRKVGMGIPLFRQSALDCGGTFDIFSTQGVGTTVVATYKLSNIDRMPLGDIATTIATIVSAAPQVKTVFNYSVDDQTFSFDTEEVKVILGEEVSLSSPMVFQFLIEYIKDNVDSINGGRDL